MIDVAVKFGVVLFARMWAQSQREGSSQVEWMQDLKIQQYGDTPPPAPSIPRKPQYLHAYRQNVSYVEPQKEGEKPKVFRKRVYDTMYAFSMAGREQPETRVARHYPVTDWKHVWTNLHSSGASETITAVWYAVIHDIISTNVRLHNIRLAHTPTLKDTRLHRLIEC
jgi:hypothetical protein